MRAHPAMSTAGALRACGNWNGKRLFIFGINLFEPDDAPGSLLRRCACSDPGTDMVGFLPLQGADWPRSGSSMPRSCG
jgi:hypothetical protein